MPHEATGASKTGFSILVVDSDPAFLNDTCRTIAANGHRAWGARDLIAAMSFLNDQTPHAILVELPLLETDGSDPLGDLRSQAPAAPIILTSNGSRNARFDEHAQAHVVYGHHNKERGKEGLLLWLNSALATVRRTLLAGKPPADEPESETLKEDS